MKESLVVNPDLLGPYLITRILSGTSFKASKIYANTVNANA